MRVKVLVAGVYSDPSFRQPVAAGPGDVIEVAGGWYAARLIAAGQVTNLLADPEPPALPAVKATEARLPAGPSEAPAKAKRPAARKRAGPEA